MIIFHKRKIFDYCIVQFQGKNRFFLSRYRKRETSLDFSLLREENNFRTATLLHPPPDLSANHVYTINPQDNRCIQRFWSIFPFWPSCLENTRCSPGYPVVHRNFLTSIFPIDTKWFSLPVAWTEVYQYRFANGVNKKRLQLVIESLHQVVEWTYHVHLNQSWSVVSSTFFFLITINIRCLITFASSSQISGTIGFKVWIEAHCCPAVFL